MGITTGQSPIVMDAAGDDLDTVFQTIPWNVRDSRIKMKITDIKYVAGSSGQCVLLNKAGGAPIWVSKDLNAGEVDETAFGDSFWLGGVYVETLPANGKVFLYYD